MTAGQAPRSDDIAPRTTNTSPERQGTFEVADYRDELDRAPGNHQVGSTLCFENEVLRVFHIDLLPGERLSFHVHDRPYFWTVTQAGRAKQRFADGRLVVRDYELGDTKWLPQSLDNVMIHDLENVGDTSLRFVTAEILS